MATGDQDIVALGLNIDSFDAKKLATLKQYIALFNDLAKYDGKIFNPVMGDGLQTFNTSIAQTNKLIEEMNSKLAKLAANSRDSSSASSANAKASNEVDAATKAYNKTLEENVKAYGKLTLSRSEILKQNAALKVQMAEMKKALMDEAKANNDSFKARMAEIDAQKKQSQATKENAAIAKKAAKERSDADKQASKDAIASMKAQEDEMKRQEKEMALLSDKHYQLKQLLKSQQKEYVNNFTMFGADDERTKKSLKTAQETAGILDGINVDLRTAEGNASAFGRSLTRGLSVLRNLAYILPGIGLAGIFNLAFEAIGKVITQTGIFANYISQGVTINTKLNVTLKEQLGIYSEIVEKMIALEALNHGSIQFQEKALNVMKQRGESQDKLLDEDLRIINEKVAKSTDSVNRTFDSPENIQNQLSLYLEKIKIESLVLNKLKAQEQRNTEISAGISLENASKGTPSLYFQTKGEIEAKKALSESKLGLLNDMFKLAKETADKYYDSIDDRNRKIAEIDRYNSEQERKLLVENTKSAISVEENKTSIVLSNIQSTHDARLNALKDEENQQKRQNAIDKISIIGTLSNPNLQYTSETSEYKAAINKEIDENRKATQKYNDAVLQENIHHYEKMLKAEIEGKKNEVEVNAIQNERIQQNESSSLEDRLAAYANYILGRSQLQELEYQLSIGAGKSSADDLNSSLTPEEKGKFKSDRDKQILIDRANAEEKVYEIVTSSLRKQLNAITDAAAIEGAINKKQLVEDLVANNERYIRKEQSLRKWLLNKHKIEEKDKKESLQKDIDDDEFEIIQLLNQRLKLFKGLGAAKNEVGLAVNLPDSDPNKKFEVDKATGKYNGYVKALVEADKTLTATQKKQIEDRLKQAQVGFVGDGKVRKEWIDAALEIEKALYQGIKTVSDRIYENKLQRLEREKELIDEQFEYEQQAIQKSSLNAKDKAALDIQIQEQKREYDIASRQEERRIKIEEAEFDKKLAIANAGIGIAAAIIRDGLTTPKSIADAVVGAIQIATIIATPIPSYKHGVIGTKKGQVSRFGEDGAELVKEPGKEPYIALTETIKYLPKGTDVIPLRKDYPIFSNEKRDSSWEQTRFLANQIKRGQKEIKNIFKPTIVIDMGFEQRKKEVLGNG